MNASAQNTTTAPVHTATITRNNRCTELDQRHDVTCSDGLSFTFAHIAEHAQSGGWALFRTQTGRRDWDDVLIDQERAAIMAWLAERYILQGPDDPAPAPAPAAETIQMIPLCDIAASFGNDRTTFDQTALQELADSIRTNGLAQPITVRPLADGKFQLIAGERRYRAHVLLQAATIRAVVTPMDDERAAAVMLVENTGRKDLDPIDEARAYARRRDEFNWDEKTIAERAGVGIQTVRNRLALLTLRADLQDIVKTGVLPIGYALVIAQAGLDNNRQMIALQNLNSNPAPSVTWLRSRCSELGAVQAQGDMFDNALFQAHEFKGVTRKAEFDQKLPPVPGKNAAPRRGKVYAQMIAHQIAFWQKAASDWDGYGKSKQRDACLIAAKTLQDILELMPKTHGSQSKMLQRGGRTYVIYEAAI